MTRTLAALFSSEPPDGTHLLVWHGGKSTVIWRRDAGAVGEQKSTAGLQVSGRKLHPDRTFPAPSTLADWLQGADDVHLIVRLDQAGRREAEAVFAKLVT